MFNAVLTLVWGVVRLGLFSMLSTLASNTVKKLGGDIYEFGRQLWRASMNQVQVAA